MDKSNSVDYVNTDIGHSMREAIQQQTQIEAMSYVTRANKVYYLSNEVFRMPMSIARAMSTYGDDKALGVLRDEVHQIIQIATYSRVH